MIETLRNLSMAELAAVVCLVFVGFTGVGRVLLSSYPYWRYVLMGERGGS